MGEGIQGIVLDLIINSSTVRRTLEHFWATGDVQRKDFPAESGDCKIKTTVHLFLILQLIDNPGINLKELKDSLLVELGI